MQTNHHNKKYYTPSLGVDRFFFYTSILGTTYPNPSISHLAYWNDLTNNFVSCSKCVSFIFTIKQSKKYCKISKFNHYDDLEKISPSCGNFGSKAFAFINQMRVNRYIQSGYLITNNQLKCPYTYLNYHPKFDASTPFNNVRFVENRWSDGDKRFITDKYGNKYSCPFDEVKALKDCLFLMCAYCDQGPLGVHDIDIETTIVFIDEDIFAIEKIKRSNVPPLSHHRLTYKNLSLL